MTPSFDALHIDENVRDIALSGRTFDTEHIRSLANSPCFDSSNLLPKCTINDTAVAVLKE